jgi:hypothetical protein
MPVRAKKQLYAGGNAMIVVAPSIFFIYKSSLKTGLEFWANHTVYRYRPTMF